MRRCLHSLLVGVLTFSLSVDAARACGHLRHWRTCPRACAAPMVVTESVAWGDCCGALWHVSQACAAADCTCGGPLMLGGLSGCGEIPCGAAVECCGSAVAESVVASPMVAETVLSAAPAAAPTPAAPSPVASSVPELEPVEPVAATEPVAAAPQEPDLTIPAEESAGQPVVQEPEAPVPAVEEPAAAEQPPASPPAPQRPNVFEEADVDGAPAAETLESPVSDDQLPAAVGDDAPASPPVADEPATDEPEPAFEPPAFEPPALEPDPTAADPTAAVEPLRRWIDDTASYAVVGRLVAVGDDAVEIRKADGRSVTVPVARLSGFDRDYVAEAGPRVAAAGQRGPDLRETASR